MRDTFGVINAGTADLQSHNKYVDVQLKTDQSHKQSGEQTVSQSGWDKNVEEIVVIFN